MCKSTCPQQGRNPPTRQLRSSEVNSSHHSFNLSNEKATTGMHQTLRWVMQRFDGVATTNGLKNTKRPTQSNIFNKDPGRSDLRTCSSRGVFILSTILRPSLVWTLGRFRDLDVLDGESPQPNYSIPRAPSTSSEGTWTLLAPTPVPPS